MADEFGADMADEKQMELNPCILDEEDDDDSSQTAKRESISSYFVRACGLTTDDVFEDQAGVSTPSSTAHTPLVQNGFLHAYYLVRAARCNWLQINTVGGRVHTSGG